MKGQRGDKTRLLDLEGRQIGWRFLCDCSHSVTATTDPAIESAIADHIAWMTSKERRATNGSEGTRPG